MALIIYFSLFYHRTVDFYQSMILSLYESGIQLNFPQIGANMNEFKSEITHILTKVPIKVAAIMTNILLNLDWFDSHTPLILSLQTKFKSFSPALLNFPHPSHLWMSQFATAHAHLLTLTLNITSLEQTFTSQLPLSPLNYTKVSTLTNLAQILPPRPARLTLSIWPILMYFASAIICLGCSTIFHWFYPMNSKVYEILHR